MLEKPSQGLRKKAIIDTWKGRQEEETSSNPRAVGFVKYTVEKSSLNPRQREHLSEGTSE